MPVTSAQVVATARKYVGRPLRHQGRGVGKDGAFDCVGLVLAVAEDLGLVDTLGTPIRRADYGNYGPQPVDGFVQREIARRLAAQSVDLSILTLRAKLEPADIITLRVPSIACHVAIVSSLPTGLGMIHAYSGNRKVVECCIDNRWLGRVAGVFRFPGVAE